MHEKTMVQLAVSAYVSRQPGVRVQASFPVRCDDRGTFPIQKRAWWLCLVVKSLQDVAKVYGKPHKNSDGRTLAFVRCNRQGVPDDDGCLGIIVFPDTRRLGNSMVAHEATHVAIFSLQWMYNGHAWDRRKFRKKERRGYSDEKVCLAVGNAVHWITKGLFRSKIWR